MANLSFVSSFTAFSGIILLAATVLLAGKAFLPDSRIRREIKSITFQKDISQSEQAYAQNLLTKIRAAGALDQTGRNGVYAEVGNLWAALLKDEQRKLKDEIESDTAGKGELARIIGLMPNPYPLAFYSIRMDRLHFYIKDPYFVDLINAYLKLNLRIEKSRIASAPVIYDWENTSRYQEILNRWETTAQSDPSKELSEELTRLKASNHFNWSPMLIALAMGLVCTWFWIWLCGIGVEFLNLLLGHFEWMKQLQEKSKN